MRKLARPFWSVSAALAAAALTLTLAVLLAAEPDEIQALLGGAVAAQRFVAGDVSLCVPVMADASVCVRI